MYSKPLLVEPSKNLLMNYLLVTHFTSYEGCTSVFAHNGNRFELVLATDEVKVLRGKDIMISVST